MLGIKRWEDYF